MRVGELEILAQRWMSGKYKRWSRQIYFVDAPAVSFDVFESPFALMTTLLFSVLPQATVSATVARIPDTNDAFGARVLGTAPLTAQHLPTVTA